MAHSGALTARDEHLRLIDTLLRPQARRGGLVLVGAAGTGKTRLLREAERLARRHGARSTWVAGSETAADLTLGAFAGIIAPDALATAASLGRAVADLAPPGERTLVCVDDAHLLDHGSSLLVQRLVVSRAAVVMMTVRDTQPMPDLAVAAWKDRWLERMDVLPFTLREARTMLEALLGGPVHGETATRLWRLTAGNPLYLRMLVLEGLRQATLRESVGWWHWSGPVAVGAGLADVVRAHLGRAPDEAAAVVDLLAVSEPLTPAVLARCASRPAIEMAEQAGLVSVEEGAGDALQVRLAHPMLGEVRRSELGVLEQRRLRGRLARAMAEAGSGHEGEVLRRADLMAASDLEPDLALLVEATGIAAAHSNAPLALRLARAAADAGGGFASRSVVAMAVTPVEGPAAARAELDRLQEVASGDTELAAAAILAAVHLAWVEPSPAEARRRLRTALESVSAPVCRDRLVALDCLIRTHLGEPEEAARVAVPLLDSSDPDVAVPAATAVSFCHAVMGRAAALAEVGAAGMRLTSPVMSGLLTLPMLAAQSMGYRAAGMLREDAAVTRLAGELGEGLPIGEGAAMVLAAASGLAAGRPGTARELAMQARVALEPFGGYGGWAWMNAITLLHATALAGHGDALAEASAELDRRVHPTMRLLAPEALLARSAAAGASGGVTEATRLASEAAELAAGSGQLAHEVVARARLVGLGAQGQAERLGELAALVDGPRAVAAAAHAQAWESRDGPGLLAAATTLEGMGDVITAAEAVVQAAEVFERARGRSREARQAQHRAAQLIGVCEDARTPTLDVFRRPLPLSAREREVVALVAQGLSNKEIADQLVVSVRTVEGHAHRAATKLGVGRAEFAEMVTPPDTPGRH